MGVQFLDLSPSLIASVFEHAHDAIMVFAADTQEILAVNPRACDLYGLPEEQLVGSSLAQHTENTEAGRRAIAAVLEYGSIEGFRTRHRRADGSAIWFEMNATVIEHRGVRAVASIGRDITSQVKVEEHQRQAERDYRMLFDASPHPMWIYEPVTLKFLAVNDAAVEQYGFTKEEFLATTLRDIRPDSEIPRFLLGCEGPLKELQKSGPWVHKRKNGTTLDVEITSHEITFRGSCARLVRIEDVTERLKAERALHASEARYRSVIENAQDVITILDENAIILYESPSVERAFGYRPEELVGRCVLEFIHPEDFPGVARTIGQNLEIPHSSAEAEIRFLHKNGSWRTIEAIGHNLLTEPSVRGIVINSRDMTERRAAEQALRNSQDTLHLAQRAGRIGTWEYEFETQLPSCSDENFALVGLQRSDVLTVEDWLRSVHRDDRAAVSQAFRESVEKKVPLETEYRVVWPDGSVHWLAMKSQIRRNTDGAPASLVGVNIDITLQKDAAAALERARDQAVEASRMKSQFLASMSHEIRTPLNGIVGNTGLLLETGLTQQQREYADTVRCCSLSLLHLINDLLDLSKVEAGKMSFEQRPIDLRVTLDGIRDMLAPEVAQKRIHFCVTIPPEFPSRIIGDAGRIRQIVLNFAANAVKFAECGCVEVSAYAVEAGSRFRISVRDTGPGIPEELQARLFEKFVQGDTSINRRHGGTGLGLAISKSLAEAMGGRVGVSSRVGAGAEFWVELPLELVETDAPVEVPPAVSLHSLELNTNRRVLVVEDNLVNQRLAVRLLEKYEITVDVAGNGAEAVEMWKRFPYDLILMDCQMPDVDGYEATRRIRSLENGKRTPIVAVTAHVIAEEREQCLACGMDGILGKPFRRCDLEALLAATLSAQR